MEPQHQTRPMTLGRPATERDLAREGAAALIALETLGVVELKTDADGRLESVRHVEGSLFGPVGYAAWTFLARHCPDFPDLCFSDAANGE